MLPSTQDGIFLQKVLSRLRKTLRFELYSIAGAALGPGLRLVCCMAGCGPGPVPVAPLAQHSFPSTRNAHFLEKSLPVYAKRLLLGEGRPAQTRMPKNKSRNASCFVCFLALENESGRAGSHDDPKSQKYQIIYAKRPSSSKKLENLMFFVTFVDPAFTPGSLKKPCAASPHTENFKLAERRNCVP